MNKKISKIIITEDEVRIMLQGHYRGITLSYSNSTSLHQKSVEVHSFGFYVEFSAFSKTLISISKVLVF